MDASDRRCRLPLQPWGSAASGHSSSDPFVKNRLTIDPNGMLYWNDAAVSFEIAKQYVELTSEFEPVPIVFVQPDRTAPCDAVRKVMTAAARTLRCHPEICRFGWTRVEARDPGWHSDD